MRLQYLKKMSSVRKKEQRDCCYMHINMIDCGPFRQYNPVCRIRRLWRSPMCKLYSTEEKNCVKNILRVSNVRTTSCITYSLHQVMYQTHLGTLPLLYLPRLKLSGILILH